MNDPLGEYVLKPAESRHFVPLGFDEALVEAALIAIASVLSLRL
jgi:hypothetical protein